MKPAVIIILSFFCFSTLNIELFGQNLLKKYPKVKENIIDSDSTRQIQFQGLPEGIEVISFVRVNEYFIASDTLKRDYVSFGNTKQTIDKLQKLAQCDYTGNYDVVESRWVKNRFLVVCFVNTFIMGTDQNVFFVLFECNNEQWKYIGVYENEADKPTTDIKVVFSSNKIKLKGKYLKEIVGKSL